MATAITGPTYFAESVVLNKEIPTEINCFSLSLITISGQRKLFQLAIACKITNVEITGQERGTMILKKRTILLHHQ